MKFITFTNKKNFKCQLSRMNVYTRCSWDHEEAGCSQPTLCIHSTFSQYVMVAADVGWLSTEQVSIFLNLAQMLLWQTSKETVISLLERFQFPYLFVTYADRYYYQDVLLKCDLLQENPQLWVFHISAEQCSGIPWMWHVCWELETSPGQLYSAA